MNTDRNLLPFTKLFYLLDPARVMVQSFLDCKYLSRKQVDEGRASLREFESLGVCNREIKDAPVGAFVSNFSTNVEKFVKSGREIKFFDSIKQVALLHPQFVANFVKAQTKKNTCSTGRKIEDALGLVEKLFCLIRHFFYWGEAFSNRPSNVSLSPQNWLSTIKTVCNADKVGFIYFGYIFQRYLSIRIAWIVFDVFIDIEGLKLCFYDSVDLRDRFHSAMRTSI